MAMILFTLKIILLYICSRLLLFQFASLYFKCVQINCDFASASTSLLENFLTRKNVDICFTQDIYCAKRGLCERCIPPEIIGFKLFFSPNVTDIPKVAMYISTKIEASMISQASNTHCITCVVNSSVVDKIIVASIYSPPSDFSPLTNMRHVFDNLGHRDIQRLVLCGDFNAHSNVWSNNSVTDSKGEEVERILLQHNMIVINDPNSPPTFDSGRGQSWIDLTVT